MIDKEFKQRAFEIIKSHPDYTNDQLGYLIGVSERSVRRYKKEMLQPNTAKVTTTDELSNLRYKNAYNDLKVRYNQLLKVLDEKDQALHKYESIPNKPSDVKITVSDTKKHEVVPVIVASDWHIEESVSAAITNGLNEYNLKIAEDSIKQFFAKACALVQDAKAKYEVNTVVLAILGDIINGVLRDEDLESNQVTSIEAIMLARSFLYAGIKLLAKTTGCNIKVICCVGNHGRMTDKIYYSNQIKNHLEFMMYKTLARDFQDYDNVDFDVAEGPYRIKNIFGIRVRFHHGHVARYNGGIGGLAVPVLRKAAQMNTIEKADLDVIGHFHSMQVFSNVIINGSLVGSNGFSMAMGFPHEHPQQTFFLIDSMYGRSTITPIFIDRDIYKEDTEKI
jgi:hypothetical protein